MDLHIPPPELVPYGMRAMKTAALADGGELDATERALMKAAQKLFGVEVDIDPLSPITAQELAGQSIDPTLRWQLCHGVIVMALADGAVLAVGTPQEIQNHPEVLRAYLGD